MKYFISILLTLSYLFSFSQKKIIPIAQSVLTGVTLPAGSTIDKRLLMKLSATVLLEMESKKVGTSIATVEILYLPSVASSSYNADSLVNQLTALGWNITPVETDNKYVWLQKDNRSILTYLSLDKNSTQLYFGEAATPPNLNGAAPPQQVPQ